MADCSVALDLLSVDVTPEDSTPPSAATSNKNKAKAAAALAPPPQPKMPSGPVPPSGSEKRRQWVLKTLVRRGAARARLGETLGAVEDYETALAIEPENEALQKDVKMLRGALEEESGGGTRA